jgi:hypothetical protein
MSATDSRNVGIQKEKKNLYLSNTCRTSIIQVSDTDTYRTLRHAISCSPFLLSALFLLHSPKKEVILCQSPHCIYVFFYFNSWTTDLQLVKGFPEVGQHCMWGSSSSELKFIIDHFVLEVFNCG